MKISLLFFTIVLSQALPASLIANHGEGTVENATLKTGLDGKPMIVQPVITGSVGLFRQAYQQEEVDVLGITTTVTSFRYYIGAEQIERISRENYREMVKKYLQDAPELHRKLGRLGFRYENVPSMIIYYNRHKTTQAVAMKYDLRTTSTLLMEQ